MKRRILRAESLERRQLLAGDIMSMHNAIRPTDVNDDGHVTATDALAVINYINQDELLQGGEGESPVAPVLADVDANGFVTAVDALMVINELNLEGEFFDSATGLPDPIDFAAFAKSASVDSDGIKAVGEFAAVFNASEKLGPQNLLTTTDVNTLLTRASQASKSSDAIIAVVDRSGRILGVRVEQGVLDTFHGRDKELAFAIDGAVAKARTAAFFASNEAPLTSRTIRNISQSTMTQREVESSPVEVDPMYRGPGFVAPIGVGGHFPPQVPFTPQVDLFAIEHQSRDSQIAAGADAIKGTADDFALTTRFNVDPAVVPKNAETFFQTWPEAYGIQTETHFDSQSRGIGTLPGGIPLYKQVTRADGTPILSPVSASINLVGGIGVFFPGEDGYATHEQGFVNGVGQSESARTNASRVLEAEFIAFIAAAGGGMKGPEAFVRDLTEFNKKLAPLPNFALPTGRIDLVGITLEVFGPNPTQQFPIPGVDRLISVGRSLGQGAVSGELVDVKQPDLVGDPGIKLLDGQAVPQEWLVAPHDSKFAGGLSAEQVQTIIDNGVAEAKLTRAAIRLNIDAGFRPGARTAMVLAVADLDGEILGLYRMPDATIFSIDVAVAKARNTAYYADPADIQDIDRIDFNGDGVFGATTTDLANKNGDTVPEGTALTNRTFRFVVEPRYPTGIELPAGAANGLVNDPNVDLCDQKQSVCQMVGPQSILRLPGINPLTGENLVNAQPLDFDVYGSTDTPSFLAFSAFNPQRNFRDPGDANVKIAGTNDFQPLANQNGVVFFPGSSSLYLNNDPSRLVGGFGVSGDGVDQDDVVTVAGQLGFAAPASVRADTFIVGGVRLPYQKFNRNPQGA